MPDDTITAELTGDAAGLRAAMSVADINDLPDSDFAYIEPGGEKDSGGKTTPRSLRHYPVHDEAHARNAYSRASAALQGDNADAKAIANKAMPAIKAACKKFGIALDEEKAAFQAPYSLAGDTVTLGEATPVRTQTTYVPVDSQQVPEQRHGSYTGSHTHSHTANGDQGDDETHEHEHSHDGDADHGHSHGRGAPALIGRPALSAEARASLLAIRGELVGTREFRDYPFQDYEVRVASGPSGERVFTGYASVFGAGYTISDFLGDFTETVSRNAFDRTIAERCDTAFLVNHGGLTMARTKPGTLLLSPDSRGLHVEATLDARRTDVGDLCLAIEAKAIDEMSFAFRCMRDAWSAAWDERELLEVSLHHGDVCPVNFGANGATAGLVSLRSLQQRNPFRFAPSLRELASALREWRSGAALSSANKAVIRHALSLFVTADTAVDEGQVILSDLLGVPNPDKDQDVSEQQGAGVGETRDLGDACNCCPACMGSACDGSCCSGCSVGDIGASYDPDSMGSQTLAAADADRERRLRLRMKGERP